MAKFCTKCGKPLKDGKPCDCEKKIKEEPISNNLGENIIDIFKNIFIKPFDTIKRYTNKDNTKLALILSGINILVFGLFIYFFISSFAKGIVNAINNISSSLSMFTSTSVTESINVPFFEFFITGIITMAIFLLALSLMTKLFAGVIFKNKKTVKEYLVLYGITSPINTITTLIAIIFSFISYKLSLIVILIGTVMYFVSISQSLLDIYKVNKERFPYIVAFILTTAYIITIVALVIVLGILIYNQNAALYY